MRRKDPPMYKRNKGRCGRCDSDVGPFTVINFPHGNINEIKYICNACLVKALLIAEAPSPKKKASVSELPENDMASIQRGLADVKAGRTSVVRLDSPYIP